MTSICQIVYIDDEPLLCENFFDEFSSEKIHIRTFTDPKKAILSIQQSPPHLVFVDYRLPGMTGLDLCRQLAPEIPKVLVTGEINLKPMVEFRATLSKPASVAKIRELIETLGFAALNPHVQSDRERGT